MYFNNGIFNPQYMNPNYYYQHQQQIAQYNYQQNQEVLKVAKAAHDLFEALEKLDEQHKQQALYACIAEAAKVYGWNNA